jgi:dihydropyrimidinase
MIDLKVINGTLFIPGVGLVKAGVGIKEGKIEMIASDGNLPEAAETVDAEGKYVTPGWIDPHVHLGIFSTFEGECETETRYALSGGVTTLGAFMGGADSYLPILPDSIKVAEEKISTDLMFHLSIFTPQQMDEMETYYEKFGVTSFKFYMAGVKGVFPNVPDDFIKKGFEKIAKLGYPAIGCVHCEDQEMVDKGYEYVEKNCPQGSLKDWSQAHPNEAEAVAARRFIALARETGARAYMVHMSTKEAAQVLRELFKEGRENIYIETTSAYCAVNNEDPAGMLAKMIPAIREQASVDAMWEAVKNDIVSCFGTDNVSSSSEGKKAENLMEVMGGFPVVGTHVPALLTEGYHKRGVSWMKIIEKATRGPAEAYGIYPQKGTIAVGSDADLVVLDLDKEKKVDPKGHYSFSDFSLFQGRTLKGWPVKVMKGGKLAVDDGKILIEPGSGNYLRRKLQK